MKTTVVCRNVRPTTENDKRCVVIASRDDQAGDRLIDLTSDLDLTEARNRLRAQGIVLGGPLQPAPRPGTPSGLTPPVEIIARDEQGKEHRLIADYLEEYSLSSGSTLYFFDVSEVLSDCRWLVGRTLEVVESGSHQPDLVEPIATANRPRE
jgi:hypothetical protein